MSNHICVIPGYRIGIDCDDVAFEQDSGGGRKIPIRESCGAAGEEAEDGRRARSFEISRIDTAVESVCDDSDSGTPILQLITGFGDSADVEEQWQERALCAQTDPEAFFLKRVVRRGKRSASAWGVKFVTSVSNMPLLTTNVSEFGVGCPKGNGGASNAASSDGGSGPVRGVRA